MQLQETVMGTKFAPPDTILFMGYLEDKILNSLLKNLSLSGATLMIFLWFGNMTKQHLKRIFKNINSCHPTITFTAWYSLDKINFLNKDIVSCGNELLRDLYMNPRNIHQYYNFHLVTHIILKNLFHMAKLSVLIGFVQ